MTIAVDLGRKARKQTNKQLGCAILRSFDDIIQCSKSMSYLLFWHNLMFKRYLMPLGKVLCKISLKTCPAYYGVLFAGQSQQKML